MNNQPVYKPPTVNREPVAISPAETKGTSIKVPLILMVWPAVVFVGAILLYAVIGYLTEQFSLETTSGSSDELFGDQSVFKTIVNVLLFLVGSLSVAVGPISFITGLVLLIVRLNERNKKMTV